MTTFARCGFSIAVAAALLVGCGGSQPPTSTPAMQQMHTFSAYAEHPVCTQAIEQPTCLALTRKGIQPACTGSSCGWTPKDLQSRYKLPISKGSGQIVAVVDAGDNPNATSDIATYRSHFALGTAKFFKYNQEGRQSNYPKYTGWSTEIDLDIEMASASCPKCTIYLIEANSSDASDLEISEREAVTLGAHIVSNSWTCQGSASCLSHGYFDTRGVEYLAAMGTGSSNEIGPPAIFDTVVAVGGTQLMKNGSQYSEIAWDGSSGGCTANVRKPRWQHDTFCDGRAVADVSAEAGCSPGVAEYDSFDGGWFGVCGASVPTALLAGIFGLAGNASDQDGGRTFWQKVHHKDLYLISQGHDNGCAYHHGRYNTCSGWGSPDGTGAF